MSKVRPISPLSLSAPAFKTGQSPTKVLSQTHLCLSLIDPVRNDLKDFKDFKDFKTYGNNNAHDDDDEFVSGGDSDSRVHKEAMPSTD